MERDQDCIVRCVRAGRGERLLRGAGVVLLLTSSGTAFAQSEPGLAAEPVVDDIVVTAQRRETRLQDTPIAISAFTAESLDERGVSDIRDLALTTPGLVVSGSAGFDVPTSIRGVSSSASGIGADLPVAFYVDGVYLARGNSAVFGLVDIERVEVLKGPQGTLFGRNATAGAINIVSREPDDSLSIYGDILYGRFDEARLRVATSGPISQVLGASLSGSIRRRSGFQRNLFDGRRINGEESSNFRAGLFYRDEGVRISWRADRGYFETPIANKGLQADPLYQAPISLPVIDKIVRNIDVVSNNDESFSERREWGTSLTAEVELNDDLLIRSISSYRQSHVSFQVDTDGSAASQIRSNQRYEKQNQQAQELQLVATGSTLSGVLGVYAFREHAETLFFADSFIGNLRQGFSARNTTRSFAAFGEARFAATERLSLTAGIRYTDESKHFSNIFQVLPGQPTPPGRTRPDAIEFTNPRIFQRRSWSSVTPRFIVDYRFSPSVFAYASASRGFKSGGFNFTSASDPAFNPETVWSYEVGLKTDLFDRRLRFNVAAYHQSYKDLQIRLASGPGVTAFANASDARIRGVEVEAVLKLGERSKIEAAAALSKAEYSNYVAFAANPAACPGGRFSETELTCDLSGNALNRAPRFAGSIAFQHSVPIAADALVLRVEGSRNSKLFYNDQNTLGHSGWVNLDASIAYVPKSEAWEVRAWTKNITNDRYFTFINTVGPAFIGLPNTPTTYGITFSFKR